MDPRTYCEDAIRKLRSGDAASRKKMENNQVVVVLAYFIQHEPSERDFASQLKTLAESADRSHRQSLAAAARAVLSDWQSRTETSNGAQPA